MMKDTTRAHQTLLQAIALAEEVENLICVAYSLRVLGLVQMRLGDIAGALASASRAIDLLDRSGDRHDLHWLLEVLALTLTRAGLYDEAATLLGSLLSASSISVYTEQRQEALDTLRNALEPIAFERALEAGGELSYEEKVAFAQSTIAKALAR
jgi:hypothetical protein